MSENGETKTCTFRKIQRKGNVRSRMAKRARHSSSGSSSDGDTMVVRRGRDDGAPNPLKQSTQRFGQKRRKHRSGSSSSDDDKAPTASLAEFSYQSSGADRVGPADMGATRQFQQDTEYDRDAEAIAKRSISIGNELKDKTDDKIYRGMNNYAKYIEAKDSVVGNAGSGLNRHGPIRAPNFIRTTVRWDYAPDICKDYKETGYCTFGDSCKFMHDRTDYKRGWEIEREMDRGTFGQQDADDGRYEIHSDEEGDDLPHKCLMCRKSFNNPVVTPCDHYFCQKCLEEYFAKRKYRCFVCGFQTGGRYKPALNLIEKLNKLRNRDSDASDASSKSEEESTDSEAEQPWPETQNELKERLAAELAAEQAAAKLAAEQAKAALEAEQAAAAKTVADATLLPIEAAAAAAARAAGDDQLEVPPGMEPPPVAAAENADVISIDE